MPPHESLEARRVALYARTWGGDPDNSLEVQVEALHEYVRRNGLDAVRAYFEVLGGRNRFHEMMADATGEDPAFRQILVHDMGRLSRWADGLNALRGRLGANGVEVVPVTIPAGEATTGRRSPSHGEPVEGEERRPSG